LYDYLRTSSVGNFDFQYQIISWITSQILFLKYHQYFMLSTNIVRVV